MKRSPFGKESNFFCYLIIILILISIACASKSIIVPESKNIEKMETSRIKPSWELEWENLIKAAKKEQWLVRTQ